MKSMASICDNYVNIKKIGEYTILVNKGESTVSKTLDKNNISIGKGWTLKKRVVWLQLNQLSLSR